jgi:transcriptional regulator with XRE-family HTH domain
MSMTVDQILAEARQLSRASVAELLDRIGVEFHGGIDPTVEHEWIAVAQSRLAETEQGIAKAIPGDEVMARMRKLVGQ